MIFCIKVDLAFDNLQRLMCHKTQTNNQRPTIYPQLERGRLHSCLFQLNWGEVKCRQSLQDHGSLSYRYNHYTNCDIYYFLSHPSILFDSVFMVIKSLIDGKKIASEVDSLPFS